MVQDKSLDEPDSVPKGSSSASSKRRKMEHKMRNESESSMWSHWKKDSQLSSAEVSNQLKKKKFKKDIHELSAADSKGLTRVNGQRM